MLTFAPKFVLILMLATLALFLFPAASGSFTATHGPTTALRSLKFLRDIFRALAAWAGAITAVFRAIQTSRHHPDSESLIAIAPPAAQLRC